jgi:hypothetical protein
MAEGPGLMAQGPRPKAQGPRRSDDQLPTFVHRRSRSVSGRRTNRTIASRAAHDEEPTHFITVDLEVFSRRRLKPLVAALGEKVIVLHEGRWGPRYHASVNGSGYRRNTRLTADQEIGELIDLIDALPAGARRLWERADTRVFDIGMQAGFHPHSHALKLSTRTIRRLADVHGTVAVTTYAAMTRADEKKKYGEWFDVWHAHDGNASFSDFGWRLFAILRKAKDKTVRESVARTLIDVAGSRELTLEQFVEDRPDRAKSLRSLETMLRAQLGPPGRSKTEIKRVSPRSTRRTRSS